MLQNYQAMDHPQERAYILANFQEYRSIQPTVIFLHGLPTALSHQESIANEVQRIGAVLRVSVQTAGKDFFTAFIEFHNEIHTAIAIRSLDRNWLMNREIRAFYGSTKFCPHYLKGHTCRLSDCNYAHYFHPMLTHLKDQAKDIDHQTIAHAFLSQNFIATQQTIYNILRNQPAGRFILPINMRELASQFNIAMQVEAPRRVEPKAEAVPEEWKFIQTQISTQLQSAVQQQAIALQALEAKRSRIQQFLDGAQRFLTRLIFQSSTFVY